MVSRASLSRHRLIGFFLLVALVVGGSWPVAAHPGGKGGLDPQPITGAKGPYTIRGIVLDPQGRPVAGYAVHLLPVLPQKGVDADNTFYRIPNRDDHRTVTDANGRFVMAGVVPDPQVEHHTYKIAPVTHNHPFVHRMGGDVLSFTQLPSNVVELTIKTEPAAHVRVTLKDQNGRPFTGSRAFSVVTGQNRNIATTVEFVNGVGDLYVHPGDAKNPGRLALLRWETAEQARVEEARQGRERSLGTMVVSGMLAQKRLVLLSSQTATVEFQLTE